MHEKLVPYEPSPTTVSEALQAPQVPPSLLPLTGLFKGNGIPSKELHEVVNTLEEIGEVHAPPYNAWTEQPRPSLDLTNYQELRDIDRDPGVTEMPGSYDVRAQLPVTGRATLHLGFHAVNPSPYPSGLHMVETTTPYVVDFSRYLTILQLAVRYKKGAASKDELPSFKENVRHTYETMCLPICCYQESLEHLSPYDIEPSGAMTSSQMEHLRNLQQDHHDTSNMPTTALLQELRARVNQGEESNKTEPIALPTSVPIEFVEGNGSKVSSRIFTQYETTAWQYTRSGVPVRKQNGEVLTEADFMPYAATVTDERRRPRGPVVVYPVFSELKPTDGALQTTVTYRRVWYARSSDEWLPKTEELPDAEIFEAFEQACLEHGSLFRPLAFIPYASDQGERVKRLLPDHEDHHRLMILSARLENPEAQPEEIRFALTRDDPLSPGSYGAFPAGGDIYECRIDSTYPAEAQLAMYISSRAALKPFLHLLEREQPYRPPAEALAAFLLGDMAQQPRQYAGSYLAAYQEQSLPVWRLSPLYEAVRKNWKTGVEDLKLLAEITKHLNGISQHFTEITQAFFDPICQDKLFGSHTGDYIIHGNEMIRREMDMATILRESLPKRQLMEQLRDNIPLAEKELSEVKYEHGELSTSKYGNLARKIRNVLLLFDDEICAGLFNEKLTSESFNSFIAMLKNDTLPTCFTSDTERERRLHKREPSARILFHELTKEAAKSGTIDLSAILNEIATRYPLG